MLQVVTLEPVLSAGGLPPPTCTLCHTVERTVTSEGVAAGADWRCTRCGQRWNGERQATVAAYARFAASRLAPEGPLTRGSPIRIRL